MDLHAYCLIDTDGATINHRFTMDYYAAKEAMDNEFAAMSPPELKGIDEDLSYIDDWDAALHINGKVHLWKIIEVLGDQAPQYE